MEDFLRQVESGAFEKRTELENATNRDYRYGQGAEVWRAQQIWEQDGLCGCCAKPLHLTDKHQILFDHRHDESLYILPSHWRGVICASCNRRIYYYESDPTTEVPFYIEDYLHQ